MDAADKPQAKARAMRQIVIDGAIGKGKEEYSAAQMRAELEAADGEPIHVTIHSEGGSVYEGNAIHDMLASYPGRKTATIQSMAFSIASFIALAFDEVEIAPNGWMMLHNPYAMVEGDGKQLAKVAGQMDELRTKMVEAYAERMGASVESVAAIMAEETFLDAQRAVEIGLADRVTASSYKSSREIKSLHKLPHGVVKALFGNSPEPAKEIPRMSQTPDRVAATAKAIKAAFPKAKAEFIVKCMEKEMTMEEVKDEYHEMSEADLELLKEQLEEMATAKAAAEEELAKAKAKLAAMEDEMAAAKAAGPQARYRTGTPAVGTGTAAPAKASGAAWRDAVKAKLQSGYNRERAILMVDREDPSLRQAYLAEING
jgi:ATP-dependent protease ClpP protease subunit